MALYSNAKGGGSEFEPVPIGTHVARCVSVVDLGFQETSFGTKEKVYIGWEIPGVRVKWTKDDVEHEGPALIGSQFTNSIHEKSILGGYLVNWRGKAFTEEERNGFDLFTILGVPCLVSVIHNTSGDRTYANISGVMALPQGTPVPDLEGELLAYSPQDQTKAGNFDKLPEWLQKKCIVGHHMDENPSEYPQGNGGAPDDPDIHKLPTGEMVGIDDPRHPSYVPF